MDGYPTDPKSDLSMTNVRSSLKDLRARRNNSLHNFEMSCQVDENPLYCKTKV